MTDYLRDLCEKYNVDYIIDFSGKWFHVYPNNHGDRHGHIIGWDKILVPDPDWEWIENRIVTVSLEVFR